MFVLSRRADLNLGAIPALSQDPPEMAKPPQAVALGTNSTAQDGPRLRAGVTPCV